MGRILIPKTSRIPYSTSQIVLAGFIDTNVGVDRTSPITLTKRTAFGYPNEWGNTGDEGYYVFVYRASPNNPNQTWYLMLQQGGEEGFGSVISATNPSTSVLEIPTMGWVLAAGVTGSISITASNRKNISIKKQNLGGGKLNAKRNIAAPSGIPTATANSIILQSGENYFFLNGAEFPRQDDWYFGDVGDWKLVWNGTRWEILGDNLYLAYYSLASNQTVNLFPDQGSWFRLADSATVTLVFVGT